MKTKWIGLVVLAGMLVLTGTRTHAQTDLTTFPPPQAPFVSAVPDKASWTITPQESAPGTLKEGESPRPKPRIANIESIRNGDLKRDLITYQSGKREEVWYYQNQVLLSGRPGKVVVQDLSSLDDSGTSEGVFRLLGNAFKSVGYPGLKWIDKTHYRGLEIFNKTIPCYHYVLRGKDADSGQDVIAAEAWIHAQTGAPVAYASEGSLYVYRFGAPPTGTLTLPPEFESAYRKVQQMQDRQKRLEADAARR